MTALVTWMTPISLDDDDDVDNDGDDFSMTTIMTVSSRLR